MTEFPWVSVSGFGAHIKSTRKTLFIQKKNTVEEYPIESVKNLLIVGGHSVSSTTLNQLIRQGTYISFFESDGTPTGTVRPFWVKDSLPQPHELQREIPRQRYAVTIAQASIKSRIFAIEREGELKNSRPLFEGEQELLHKSLDEVAYLIKLEEIRRLHRLTSDMYYEIMARNLPAELGFRRRTLRPQLDPVNAMLSLGYAMLYGNCCASIIGARLDPDNGFLYEGSGGLVYDLIEPLKAGMVDSLVFQAAKESISSADFEISHDRCMLSDDFVKKLISSFYTAFNTTKIGEQVQNMGTAIQDSGEFRALY